ncbi:MAG: preprotein translocase subunit SecY [Mycoplasma sp.]|nr:preprotein translocase subunit SecY [Candidatus Hennigella equi]
MENQTNNTSFGKKVKNTFKPIFTNKTVLVSILITLGFIVLYHLGSMLTLPGVVLPDTYKTEGSFVEMLNLLSAGGLEHMSIFAIGLGPYITAQIIIQLLSSDLVKPLAKMAKAGERGKKKLEIITRLLTLPFCFVQAYATIALILSRNAAGSGTGITIFGESTINNLFANQAGGAVGLLFLLTAGTYIAIFIGDMITKRGVGNGVTTLILVGVIGQLIPSFNNVFNVIGMKLAATNAVTIVLSCILYTFFFILIVLVVVFINGSTRKIPIQQTGQGLIQDKSELPYLPIKLNAAGVIPVIFASSVITIPGTIAQFIPDSSYAAKEFITKWLTLDSGVGVAIYFVLIILFSFFYSYIQINPQQIAENFQKGGKFIPGVRMGDDTEKHITKVLFRINWIGAPFLAIVASIPYILSLATGIPSGMSLSGTGIIIMVTASLELWAAIKSASTTSGYVVTRRNIEHSYYSSQEEQEEKVTQLW